MKKYVYFLAVLVLLSMVPTVYATWTVTKDWVLDYTATQIYNCAYNPTTDHVLVTALQTVPIYNASDGTPTGSSLKLPSGSGIIFALACTDEKHSGSVTHLLPAPSANLGASKTAAFFQQSFQCQIKVTFCLSLQTVPILSYPPHCYNRQARQYLTFKSLL